MQAVARITFAIPLLGVTVLFHTISELSPASGGARRTGPAGAAAFDSERCGIRERIAGQRARSPHGLPPPSRHYPGWAKIKGLV